MSAPSKTPLRNHSKKQDVSAILAHRHTCAERGNVHIDFRERWNRQLIGLTRPPFPFIVIWRDTGFSKAPPFGVTGAFYLHANGVIGYSASMCGGRLNGQSSIGCELDEAVLAGYCENRALAIEAAQHIATEGGVIDGKRNPWVGIGNSAWDQVRRFGDMLGLSPQARLRVVPADPAPVPSPWDEI